MKAFWGALVIILFSTNLSAQYIVKGQITQQGQPVDAASLSVLSGSSKIISTVSKPDGTYEFTVQNKRNYSLNVQHINMLDKRLELEVVNASGASKINSYDLSFRKLKVNASGASQIRITAKEELAADASGGSTIYYKGDAIAGIKNSHGGSSIRKKNENED